MADPPLPLRQFDFRAADATVWTFKKSGGAGDAPPTFVGRWIETAANLDEALKASAAAARDNISEVRDYDLLAQNNEGSALVIAVDETHAPHALAEIADPVQSKRVRHLKDINNSAFYAVRFVFGETALVGVKKTDATWRSMKSVNLRTVIFDDDVLALDERPRFVMAAGFDLFIIGEEVFVLDKANFESIFNYKQTHVSDFAVLQLEPEFVATFSALGELVAFVGTNKLHLRRLSAVKMKANYKDQEYMARLRLEARNMGYDIAFDGGGRIVPSVPTCPDIIRALLDLRLDSRLSRKIFDVDSAEAVGAVG